MKNIPIKEFLAFYSKFPNIAEALLEGGLLLVSDDVCLPVASPTVSAFIAERCILGGKVCRTDLFEAYFQWAGDMRLPASWFYRELRRLGYGEARSSSTRFIVGLSLKTPSVG